MKKFILAFSLLTLATLTAACGNASGSEEVKGTIGISMPSKSLERWEKDGNNMVKEFEALGYETDIQYAQDEIQTQAAQIENMVTKGVDAIIIAPIDGEVLSDSVNLADGQGIPVVAYDRLIMNTDKVSYYATFDNFTVGKLQGEYIAEHLNLKNEQGPFNIELFAGAPDDNNARFFFEGAMSVLQPYIDEGVLVVKSGQTDFATMAIDGWSSSIAQTRMDNLLTSSYTDNTKVDAVLAPNDAVAQGIVSSLKSMGYGDESRPMPVITGQDAEAASVKSIINEEQTMTVFKDTSKLAKIATQMVDAILKDEKPEVNDTETYDNNKKVIPTHLVDPVSVDVTNYQEILIDGGYLEESEVK
ncbi:multiple monosaccharide ABC transporter substrate-binding protein [Carnobacterium jeotgali]|uniref:multiple monosaccharide ABC transporter substrate-binding protein n=1 Tax=Carnobacterium jeotgali TaxID=545534 RepID=UPI00388D47DE